MNFKSIKNSICYLLMLTLNVMTMQSLMVSTALAAPGCTAYGANSSTANCAVIKTGGTAVAVPRLSWQKLSDNVIDQAQHQLSTIAGDNRVLTGNSSAIVMGLTSKDIAAKIADFPANVPMVVGRYEPMSRTLRVDIFKIERTLQNGKPTSALYHSTFSPAHGEYWRANGTYLSPEARAMGTSTGPNPFSQFGTLTDDNFTNISLKGAMVVLGHAQRYTGAPVSLLVNHYPKQDQYTKKSGNIFRKKVTTYVDFYAKPEYYLGAPMLMQGGIQASYCANDPTAESCQTYEAASSGVGFMKLEGGNLEEASTFVYQWSETQTGWSLLAIFVIAFVMSFAAAALAPTLTASAGGASAMQVGGGFWSNLFAVTGAGSTTALGAAAIDAGVYTAVTGTVGSGFGGIYGTKGTLYGQEKAFAPAAAPGHVSAKEYINRMVNNGVATGPIESSLAPVRTQLIGSCGTGTLLKDCSGTSGILPRGDGFTTFEGVEFIRDNSPPKPVGAGY